MPGIGPSPIAIDESRFPLVVVTFTGAADDATFEAYLATMTTMMERRQKTVWIMDAARSGATPPKHRKLQADWLKQQRELLSRYSLGTAFVIDSAVVRGILTAIFWMTDMAAPHVVVSSYREAEDWAIARLAEAGLRPG